MRCPVAPDAAWAIAEALEQQGAASVSLPAGKATIEALFAARGEAEAAARALGLGNACTLEILPERDWIADGRAGFAPRCYGKRLWVVPEWCRAPDPEAANVFIAPGLAFGTGHHPSTALCLEWLAEADVAGQTVIDYGCGSGILAIAAAKLGATWVVAVDNDPQALTATRANAVRNGIAVATSAPETLTARAADLLVANILARPLIALAAEFCARVHPGGRIVLAGVTAEQADVVAAAYVPRTRLVASTQHNEWVCLEFRL